MFKRRDISIRVCALGFDARSFTALQLFFRSKCGEKVILVGDDEADLGIIDLDSFNAGKILAQQQTQHPERILILLSLEAQEKQISNAIYLKKPVQIQYMLDALDTARSRLLNSSVAAPPNPTVTKGDKVYDIDKKITDELVTPKAAMRVFVAPEEKAKSTVQAATLLDERGFGEYIGSLKDIDPTDPTEVRAAQYDPKRYLQGYLQSAYKTAMHRQSALCLNTGWKPITILPQTKEVLVDADDQQLRSFCLVPVHSISDLDFTDATAGIMTISAVNPDSLNENKHGADNRQRMDTLMWKVALWTSAGRIPEDIDLHRPVYLRNWPNLTRLLVFPNAMRIAALLSEQPRSLLDIADTLQIRQQYVFAFFSAARALGLADQATRQSENLIAPPPVEPRKNAGVLKKILQRLLRR